MKKSVKREREREERERERERERGEREKRRGKREEERGEREKRKKQGSGLLGPSDCTPIPNIAQWCKCPTDAQPA